MTEAGVESQGPDPADMPVAPPGQVPNCRCEDCKALLFWQEPEEAHWRIVRVGEAIRQRWWARALVIAVLAVLGFTVHITVVLGLLLLGVVVYVVRPRRIRPRCPRCKSLNILSIEIRMPHE